MPKGEIQPHTTKFNISIASIFIKIPKVHDTTIMYTSPTDCLHAAGVDSSVVKVPYLANDASNWSSQVLDGKRTKKLRNVLLKTCTKLWRHYSQNSLKLAAAALGSRVEKAISHQTHRKSWKETTHTRKTSKNLNFHSSPFICTSHLCFFMNPQPRTYLQWWFSKKTTVTKPGICLAYALPF